MLHRHESFRHCQSHQLFKSSKLSNDHIANYSRTPIIFSHHHDTVTRDRNFTCEIGL